MKNNNKTKRKKQQSSTPTGPIILLSTGFVLILAFVFMMLFNNNTQITDQDLIPRVSVSQAQNALEIKSAIFLDVRVENSYVASHIPEAINIPVEQLETRIAELNPKQWIITYCT